MDARGLVLTYQDYAGLPDDGHRYELHDGALSVTPAPGTPAPADQRRAFRSTAPTRESTRAGEVLVAPLDDPQRSHRAPVVPYFWLVDPKARVIEAFRLESECYVLATRASGDAEVILPPFSDLLLRLADRWA